MKYTLTTILLWVSLFCFGQSCKLFTADKELSSSLINMIYQDRNNIIWIATEDGLNRYDGAKFKIYRHENGNDKSLCNNYVHTLFEDSKGNLIIGTYNGLQLYNPETDNFSEPAKWDNGKRFQYNVSSIIERKNGEILMAGDYLCSLKIKSKHIIVKRKNLAVSSTRVSNLVEDKDENLWWSKDETGLFCLDNKSHITNFKQASNLLPIYSLCKDPYDNIFVGGMERGLLKYNRKRKLFESVKYNGKEDLPVKYLYSGGQDEMFIGTDGKGMKVLNYRTGSISDYSFDNSYFDYRTSKVHSILKDNFGNLWLAIYQKGVMMIPAKPNNFKYWGYKSINKNIIGSNCITSLCRDGEGTLWVGTDNDGIYGVAKEGVLKAHFKNNDNPNSIASIILKAYKDSENDIWLGFYTNGMAKMNTKTGTCSYIKELVTNNGYHVQHVYDFAEDKNKRVWIATMGGGLFYYDLKDKKISYPAKANNELNNWISCLLYSKRSNKLYAGTYDGIFCINLNDNNFKWSKSLSRHIVHSLYEDNQGFVWAGTSEGLYKVASNSRNLENYTTKDGLPSNSIYAIQGDSQNNLWISTNSGISRYDIKNNKFINYYVSDGLQGNEFTKNASFKDNDGTIWFGGMNGVTFFNPQEIINPAKKCDIRITDFYLNNKSVTKGTLSGGKEIIDRAVFDANVFNLSHSDNTFTIEFSTLDFNNQERINYVYSMNNSQWITLPKGINRVSFSNLAPDTYHFKIKAVDNSIESDVKELTIIISPAWWVSWWAKLIYFFILAGIVYFIIIQIRQRYHTKQKILQHIHSEEINEAKLQFFINISHEIRTPMSLVMGPIQNLIMNDKDLSRQKIYRTIYRNSERILNLVNQLMDIRKIDKGQMSLLMYETNIIEFIDNVLENFKEQTSRKHIDMKFHHDGIDSLKLWIDPNNFDKIILNILSNAFKFTPENGNINIYISSEYDNTVEGPMSHYAKIIIADNGIGVDKSEVEHIFERFYQIRNSANNSNVGTGIGLHLTRSLVELHHGDIHADNNLNGEPGCRFIIRIPIGNAHLKPEEMGTEDFISDNNEDKSLIENKPYIYDYQEDKIKIHSKSKYHVLVVEDDEEIRHYICQELSSEYHIAESCNGKEALEMIFKRKPDLVISDIMMPVMDGNTLCKKIKLNVNLNYIPVVLLTAKTRDEDNIESLENGADAYITKPFNMEVLKKTIDNLITSRERLKNTFSGKQIKEEQLNKIEAKSADDKLMERIMKVINANLSNSGFTIEMLSEEVGISRVHLHRKLKELTNQTTRDYIKNIRLKQAATLLSQKHYSVLEVTELTGFSNPNYFSTAFKDLYGVSPTAYRDEQLEKKGK